MTDQETMEVVLEYLEKRKKEIQDVVHKHAMGRCLCSQVRRYECHRTQNRLRTKVKTCQAVIRDIEERQVVCGREPK